MQFLNIKKFQHQKLTLMDYMRYNTLMLININGLCCINYYQNFNQLFEK